MKIAIVTDTHAGARNDSYVFNQYFIDFFEHQFFPYLIENKIDTVIHLGDVFDRRKYANFHTLNTWREKVFDRFAELKIDLHIVLGNHDVFWKNTNEINSVTEILRQYQNITIYSGIKEVTFDDLPVLFVPWINEENEEDILTVMKDSQCEITMGHFEILGFQMHRGHVNDEHGLTKDSFTKFDMVLSGHYHHKSSYQGIHYLGSPYEMTWNDWGDTRGFHIFDTASRDLEFVENTRKIFHKTYYNDEKETLESLLNQDFTKYKNLYIKVIVEKKTNPYWFDQFVDSLFSANPSDVKIIESVLEDEDNDEFEEDSLDAKDTLTILTDYVDGMQIVEGKEELVQILRTLYTEAANMDIE